MAHLPEKLRKVLDSDCTHDLESILETKDQEDFEALQALLSMDSSIRQEQRLKALHVLGRWGDAVVVTDILRLLPNLDEIGRVRAADALGRLGTQGALEGILDLTNDSSPQVRKFAAQALSRINTSEAQVKLREMANHDSVDYVRSRASVYIEENPLNP